ncbi:DUF1287 domain-containing protein [Dyella silvatica]|uniref:DUF1287 domain-containing protein n=1 Tax=Dyella silvatica TaxID=2992128 RepID=UPI0022503694|nr:DUF1287 domain-containing protein [Dyella silvatica]
MNIHGWLMGCVLALALLPLASLWAATPAADTARMLAATHHQVGRTLIYDSRDQFPGGDLPLELNRDMREHFAAYPPVWGLRGPDPNIDHRRVPHLETYFRRHGMALPLSKQPHDYQPGDIVSWRPGQGEPHLGIVSDRPSRDGLRPLLIHHKGWGARQDDVLFSWQITGHFRYFSASSATHLR